MEHQPPPCRPSASPPIAGDLGAWRVRVRGAVQGVGFRPFVHGLASELALTGEVRNTGEGVEIDVAGPVRTLETFVGRLVNEAPPLALVEDLAWVSIQPPGGVGFRIAPSAAGALVDTLVTADAATCPDCLRELLDPADRRYRYPFINCTNCGPRYTITRAVPYDRPSTTMAGFTMCPACRAEYDDPADRRFHAQPNACPLCGPHLGFFRPANPDRRVEGEPALAAAVDILLGGGVVAVKGLGGYHLACDALDETAVTRLRARKQRDEKPFAVMAGHTDDVRRFCQVSQAEEQLLTSARRPVVLFEKRADDGPAPAETVAPGMAAYGFFLPYTPLHHLLLRDCGRPLVMTSGNLSDEPIAYRDDDAFERLAGIADGFLIHDRPIHIRVDDSVARAFREQPYPLRRARGYAPLPVTFAGSATQILAVGGHLKNTFCLTRGSRAFLSHHIGDLENLQTLRSLREGVAHLRELFALQPGLVAHDLHPDYLSTRFAREYATAQGLPTLAVQHHEAHIAAVVADAGYPGPVVGVAFDGAGYGPDGTIWGGEIFVGTAGRLTRAAHLAPFPLPGGDAAVREPWRMALVLLDLVRAAAGEDDAWIEQRLATLAQWNALGGVPHALILQAARQGLRSPLTSSVGRLFDGVAALLGLRHYASYEGQAAMLLEAAAIRAARRLGLPGAASEDEPSWHHAREKPVPPPSAASDPVDAPVRLPTVAFAQSVLRELDQGLEPDVIALHFHHNLAQATARTAAALAGGHGCETVALSGGVFQNMLLLELLSRDLEARGLRVLVHRNVPTNDGGLCLGQAQTAAAIVLRNGAA